MLSDIIAAFPLPTLVIGKDDRVQTANDGACELLGRGIAGRHYIAIIRQPTLLDAIEDCRNTGTAQVARYLTTVARQDLTWIAHIKPIEGTGDILVALEDRTAMEEAGQMRRDFIANVSHELRTPLTALLGFIETLSGAARDDPSAQARFLDIMEREALRMNRLVQDLLSLNRVESEERVRPSTKVDIAALARSAMTALEPFAKDNNVELRAHGLDAPQFIAADADQISQVLSNLTENAIKYSGSGRRVTLRIETSEHHPMVLGPACILSVIDTGDGIDAVHLPRLTERFYRIDNHRSREMGGTGLGLAIVKHIINRHRGRLRVESTPGKGSVFSVILPALTEPADL